MLIRSMGPEVIAVDEIGAAEDVHAVEYAMHCGCKMIATAHGQSLDELRKKPVFDQMIREKRFERYILLGNWNHVGEIEGIYDENCRRIFDHCGDDTFWNGKSGRAERAVCADGKLKTAALKAAE